MHTTTTSPPRLQAPYIGEHTLSGRWHTEFHMLVFPIQSRRRALAVTNDTGIGRCHRSAAGHRRRHTHPDTDRTTSKSYSSSKVLWVKGAPATSSCTGGDTHLPRCELPHDTGQIDNSAKSIPATCASTVLRCLLSSKSY